MRSQTRARTCSASALFSVAMVASAVSGKAGAQEATAMMLRQLYAIPAGPVDQVLLAVGQISQGVIVFDPISTADRRSAGVQGLLSREEAVRRALEGTGLVMLARSDGAMTVERVGAVAPERASASGGMQLPEVRSTVRRDVPAPDEGFVALSISSATRTETPIAELPQSIQVITSERLRSQQARSVNDVLEQISGVLLSPDGGGIYIRGFDAPLRVDGQPATGVLGTGSALAMLPLSAIDRVAVLKGADAISAGVPAPPGGMIDVLVKRPQSEPVRQWVVESGSLGHKMSSIDLAGSVPRNDALRYRFIASGQDDSRSRDGTQGTKFNYLAPSFGYESGTTSLMFGAEVQTQRVHDGVAPYRTLGETGPQGPIYGLRPVAARDAGDTRRRRRAYIEWTQKFSDGWTFRGTLDGTRVQRDVRIHGCSADVEKPGLQDCSPSSYWLGERSLGSTSTLTKVVKVGAAAHTLQAGFTTTSIKRHTTYPWFFPETIQVAYARDQLDPALPPLPGIVTWGTPESYRVFYVQDQMQWGRWTVLTKVGKAVLLGVPSADASNALPKQARDVYSLGFAYRASDQLTVYANKKKSFETAQTLGSESIVDNRRQPAGYTAPAVDGLSTEAGMKLNILDDRLSLTTSVYQATQLHALQQITFDGNPVRYEILQSTRSKGFELDLSGRISRGWHMAASLAYNSFAYARSSENPTPLSQFPHATANLWSSYEFQRPAWRGWGYGLGLHYRSGYAGVTKYRLPGQARVDASVFYKSDKWVVTLGAKNLFNRMLNGNFASNTVSLEPPRTVTLTTVFNF